MNVGMNMDVWVREMERFWKNGGWNDRESLARKEESWIYSEELYGDFDFDEFYRDSGKVENQMIF